MLYEYMNDYIDYIDRAFKNEHAKNIAIVLFNYMQNVLHDKSRFDKDRAVHILETVHDIAVFNNVDTDDLLNIIDMYNVITNFYDSSNYRVLVSDTMLLVSENEYTRYTIADIHDIEDVKVEYTF